MLGLFSPKGGNMGSACPANVLGGLGWGYAAGMGWPAEFFVVIFSHSWSGNICLLGWKFLFPHYSNLAAAASSVYTNTHTHTLTFLSHLSFLTCSVDHSHSRVMTQTHKVRSYLMPNLVYTSFISHSMHGN